VTSARPRYGGTLRVATPGVLRSVDPFFVAATAVDAGAARQILPLLFETLIRVDAEGGLRPALASSWDSDAQGTRLRIRLRPGVTLHDGSTLLPQQAADAVRESHKEWQVAAEGDAVVIDAGAASQDIAWTLTERRSAIAIRRPSGGLIGTGPFRLERFDETRVVLRAHDDYWGSRPFVDAVDIEMGGTTSAQLAAFEAARLDLAAAPPMDRRRLQQRGIRVIASRTLELFALVFEPHRANGAHDAVRRTLAASFDRSAIRRVVLQDLAEPAESLMPDWIRGYPASALSSSESRLSRAAVLALPIERRSLTLRVDAADAVARAIAERIAVDARESGLAVVVQAPAGLAARPDVRVQRIRIDATSPDRALAGIMRALGQRVLTLLPRVPPPTTGAPLQDVYRVERALLDRSMIVPVVHVPDVYAVGARVESWNGAAIDATGAWDLANVWLEAATP
jgi:ABC-type transport system substrate-binding protein